MRKIANSVMAAGALVCGLLPAQPAQAVPRTAETATAVIYWSFRNASTGGCLSTYESGKVITWVCEDDSQAQQWHWIDSSWNGDHRLLKNRWTGRCLIATSPVTSGTCEDWTSRHWRIADSGAKNSIVSGTDAGRLFVHEWDRLEVYVAPGDMGYWYID
ncbi:hypothetical protein HCN51_36275 [Nonomuraea sp. FMUSA5-5]|uniref:Ricin B lectin domain-containing protein n=1 Tax=Nonomuraea composti TaxID=2720023 RepID=A0ABX1BDE0_9ACTN|nr:hypothetical protein [Nonomuraea sp. FMUSA5-5]